MASLYSTHNSTQITHLKQIISISRHGARTNMNKKYALSLQQKNLTFEGEDALLTHRGIQQQYEVGQNIYYKFMKSPLFQQLKVPQIHIHTPKRHRTIDSAIMQVLGIMTPPNPDYGFSNVTRRILHDTQLPLQFPIWKFLKQNSYFLEILDQMELDEPSSAKTNPLGCPLYEVMKARMRISKREQEFDDSLRESLFPKLSELFDVPKEELTCKDAYHVFDALVSAVSDKHDVLFNFTNQEMQMLQSCSDRYLINQELGSNTLLKLANHLLFKTLLKNLNPFLAEDPKEYNSSKKFIMFSTHDTFLTGFLIGIGQLTKHTPPLPIDGVQFTYRPNYNSRALIEVYLDEVTNSHFIKIDLNGKYLKFNGQEQLSLPSFIQKLKDGLWNHRIAFEDACMMANYVDEEDISKFAFEAIESSEVF